jgi:peptidoglycan hydrolase-like protein with peptidoglycan-binding domain
MKKLALGVVALALAFSFSVASASTNNFQANLTVGSRGADVSSLQTILISGGYLTAVTAPTGYFGSLTKAALAKWQAANNVAPAVGYFGPISRGVLNGAAVVTGGTTSTVPGCVAGAAFSSTTGAACGTTSAITTVGAEGTLSATQGAISNSAIYEGDVKAPLLAIKIKAQSSDIKVDRIKVDVGASTDFYNKQIKTLYVLDSNNNVLSTVNLNSDTVVKDASEYYVTLTGLNYVIAKGASQTLTVAGDVFSSVKTTPANITVKLLTDAIRGTDGAGIDQYTGSASITSTVSINTTLTDSASLTLSTNGATPLSGDVIANGGTDNNEADKVTVLAFDINAKKDNVKVTDIVASATTTNSGNLTNAYLYDGSSLLASAAVTTGGTATFSDINYTVSKDTTKTLTLKVDVRNAPVAATNLTASVAASGITAENSVGSALTTTKTGSATSNTLSVKKAGPVFTLVSKSTSKTTTADPNVATSTSILDAAFTVNVAAKGTAVVFGSVGSTTAPFVQGSSTLSYANSSFGVFLNGVELATTTVNNVGLVVDFTSPDSGVTIDNTNKTITIADGNNANITVHAKYTVTGAPSANGYSISLKKFNWNGTSTTSTDGLSSWRTDAVVLP